LVCVSISCPRGRLFARRIFVRDSLITFLVGKGRGYYLAPAYPVFVAGGAVFGAELIANLGSVLRFYWGGLLDFSRDDDSCRCGILCSAGSDSAGWSGGRSRLTKIFREEIGCQVSANTRSGRDSLGPAERSRVAILAGNTAKLERLILWERDGLPQAICATIHSGRRGSAIRRQRPDRDRISREFGDRYFESCELAVASPTNMALRTRRPPIIRHLILSAFRESWPELWRKFRRYG